MASIASLCLNRTTLAAITVTLDRASQAWITANSQGLHLVPERSRSIHGSSPQLEPIDDAGRSSHLRNIQERKAIAHGASIRVAMELFTKRPISCGAPK
jgi:hypothetical protein